MDSWISAKPPPPCGIILAVTQALQTFLEGVCSLFFILLVNCDEQTCISFEEHNINFSFVSIFYFSSLNCHCSQKLKSFGAVSNGLGIPRQFGHVLAIPCVSTELEELTPLCRPAGDIRRRLMDPLPPDESHDNVLSSFPGADFCQAGSFPSQPCAISSLSTRVQ